MNTHSQEIIGNILEKQQAENFVSFFNNSKRCMIISGKGNNGKNTLISFIENKHIFSMDQFRQEHIETTYEKIFDKFGESLNKKVFIILEDEYEYDTSQVIKNLWKFFPNNKAIIVSNYDHFSCDHFSEDIVFLNCENTFPRESSVLESYGKTKAVIVGV